MHMSRKLEKQIHRFGDAWFCTGHAAHLPPDSLTHSPTSYSMTLSPQHMVMFPPPQVTAGLHAMMGPSQQVAVTEPQLLSEAPAGLQAEL